MNEIKKVGIIGAGAVGAYFIQGLTPKLKENLIVIADGKRKEKLKSEGIVINNKKYNLNVKTPDEAENIDLLLISLKYGALKKALNTIKNLTGEDTIVMSLMNGVDTEEIISDVISEKNIVYSLIRIASERTGNSIVFDTEKTPGVYFGEKGIKEKTDRIKALEALFEGTEIHYHFVEDIIKDIWDKFALNVSNNLPQAILGCPMGAFRDSIYARAILDGLRGEVVDVAKAQGIEIEKEFDFTFNGAIKPNARYSTLQDINAKRETEIEAFAGTMLKLGKKYGIKTPYCEFAYNAIKTLEEKNKGKFDY